MIILKGLVAAGVVSGLMVLMSGSGSSSGTGAAPHYPDASLPTLFEPMRH
ncbi:hypothetical protein NX786_12885 [Telluria mixta]|uniref:Uncharacterized protein n=1 Tax=Telluria mixta TaxID=34071 RepID=A0ABT2BYL6_9BURK|nr:hypothetical protein [Telluria mixta]MCS0630232.1 hypothetical protein [Telluria mixta]WEM94460.1 hypothetical protein P0M04_23615 [Telluria mixta]